MTVTINASTSSGLITTADNSGILGIQTAGTTALTIDASQNVGIGTTTANTTLHVQGAGTTDGSIKFNNQLQSTGAYNSSPQSGSLVALKYNTGGDFAGMGGWSIGKENATDGNYSSYFAMHTRANGGAITEKVRIDSAGNLLMGVTSTLSTAKVTIKTPDGSGSQIPLCLSVGIVSAGFGGVDFRNPNGVQGSIAINTASVSYNTTSDYRLKENIVPMTGALAKLAQLKPVTYTWKATGENNQGFIAHELAEVVPQAVTGEKDGIETYTDEDGNEQTRPKYQGIDTSFLVATLTAAIKEQQAIIESLTQRITALEGAQP